ncbi:hypothetical protein KAR48_12410 [bacterium]|nr:hypothetical protein [bacterium]
MYKLYTGIKYKMRIQWNMAAWYLGIYVLTMLLVSTALIKTSVITEHDGSLIYRIWGSVVFLFAISIRFKEDFDFMLALSITRQNIFLAQLCTILGFSGIFSGLILLERIIVDYSNQVLGYHNISDPLHFWAPYSCGNLFLQFIYFFTLIFCCSAAGLLLGGIFYRFGKKCTLIFWLIFSAMPMLLAPVYLWALHQQGRLTSVMTDLGTMLKNFDVLTASATMLIAATVISIAAWLNTRRLPQR